MKPLFIILGSFSLLIGIIGIAVPGLPTTPFILLSGILYLKSSEKLYRRLKDQKYLGKYLRDYDKRKAFSKKSLIRALIFMWIMIGISEIFFIHGLIVRIVVFLVGVTGTVVMLSLKTYDD